MPSEPSDLSEAEVSEAVRMARSAMQSALDLLAEMPVRVCDHGNVWMVIKVDSVFVLTSTLEGAKMRLEMVQNALPPF